MVFRLLLHRYFDRRSCPKGVWSPWALSAGRDCGGNGLQGEGALSEVPWPNRFAVPGDRQELVQGGWARVSCLLHEQFVSLVQCPGGAPPRTVVSSALLEVIPGVGSETRSRSSELRDLFLSSARDQCSVLKFAWLLRQRNAGFSRETDS